MNLERLRDFEIAKRLLLLGVVGMLYAAGWMLFAYQGGRVGVSEGIVVKIYQDAWYTLTHEVGGVEYIATPGRIPDVLGRPRVGSRMTLYYYRNDPANAFFERREHPWPPLIAAALLVIGAFVTAEGGRRGLRSRPEKSAAAPPAFEIPFVTRSLPRAAVGVIFLFLGSGVVAMTTHLGWTTGGVPGLGALVMVVFSHGLVLGSVFVIFYRSGLALDPARGLIYVWSGLPKPIFHRYRAFEALERVDVETTQHHVRYRLVTVHTLRLHFKDEPAWSFPMSGDREHAVDAEEKIRALRFGPAGATPP